MKKLIESKKFQISKLWIGFSLMLIGMYLSFIDNSVINSGIIGTGVLLSASQLIQSKN